MKISTRIRYATRALLDLAMHQGEETVSLKDIASRQGLSQSYLEHLITPFVASGLVRSSRGPKGGVSLAVPPEEITLRRIVEVVEGPVRLVDCLGGRRHCPRSGRCATQDVWEELSDSLNGVLGATSLADLMVRQRRKEPAAGAGEKKLPELSYCI